MTARADSVSAAPRWTEQQRRNKRAEYQRLYATGHGRQGRNTIVPADVQRVEFHEPCGFCGRARECRHRESAYG